MSKQIISLCKKTPNTALLSFLKQSFTISKFPGFKNFESLVFDVILSKTGISRVLLRPRINSSIIILIALLPVHIFAQEITLKTMLSPSVKETSGLVKLNNTIITHNDSGSKAELYEIDGATGQVVRTVTVINATNVDWEDITYDDTYIYIGDFGNNSGTRKDLKIYRIRIDNYFEKDNNVVKADVIDFSYADQTDFTDSKYATNYDAEAIIVYRNQLYIFTKNWGDFKSNIYAVPKSPGTYSVKKLTTIDSQGLVTGAALNTDLNKIVLIGYALLSPDFIVEINDLQSSDFSKESIVRRELTIPENSSHQIEGIAWLRKNKYLVSSEAFQGIGPSLFELNTDTSLSNK